MSNSSDNALPKPLMFGIVTIPRFIIGTAILVGIAINVANVIGRYFFLEPIIWAEEIMIYIMVWTVFIGAILVSFEGQHLKMDFFSIMLPSPFKEIINCIAALAVLLVCVYVVPHFALLFGFVMIFVAIVVRFKSHVLGTLASEVDEIVQEYAEPDEDVTAPKNN